jgi:hypothetical protein
MIVVQKASLRARPIASQAIIPATEGHRMDEAGPILPKTAPPAQARAMDRAVVVLAGAWRDRGPD